MSLAERLNCDEHERDQMLKEQFVEGIRPPSVQGFLRRYSRNHSRLTFLELRQLALEEVDQATPNKAETASIDSKDTPQWAAELITLTKQLLDVHTNTATNAPPERDRVQRQPVKCNYCKRLGHIKRDCHKRLYDMQKYAERDRDLSNTSVSSDSAPPRQL